MSRRVTERRLARNNGAFVNYNPVIFSLNPPEATQGAGNTVVQVLGDNFSASTQIQVDGVNVTTSPFDVKRVDATIPSAVIAVPGYKTLQAIDGLHASNFRIFSVNFPAPTVSSLSVTNAQIGSTDTGTVVTGTGFFNVGTFSSIDGTPVTGSFATSTTFNVTVPTSVLATAGAKSIQITNPIPGGGTASINFYVKYPTPVLSSISPTNAEIGSPDTTITLTGTGFYDQASTVTVNGTLVSSRYISSTQMTAVVPASMLTTGGGKTVIVNNPVIGGFGGGNSGSKSLQVATPTTSALSFSSRPQFFDPMTVTVTGTNFLNTDTVMWQGNALSTTYVSATSLTAVLPKELLANSGTYPITVRTATGFNTNGQNFTVIPWSVTDMGSTLRLWLKGSGLINDGSGRASSWADASGGTRDFTAASSSQRPNITTFNGQTAAYFDGSRNDLMTYPSWVELSNDGFIQKASYTAWVAGSALVTGQATANPTILGEAGPLINIAQLKPSDIILGQDNVTSINNTFVWGAGAPFVVRHRKTGGTFYTRVNRGTESSAASSAVYSPGSVLLGQGRSGTSIYTGYVCEIIIADSDVNYTNKHQIDNRMGVLYGATMGAVGTLATVSSVSPNTSTQYNVPFEITVTGTGFTNGDFINCDGEVLATSFDSSTQMRAMLTSTSLSTPGVKGITVSTVGGHSAPVALTVAAFVPGSGPNLTSISPTAKTQYDNGFTLTCNGTNFSPSSVVYVGAQALTTHFFNSTLITADVPASVLYTSTTKSFTVIDGSQSSAQLLTMTAWSPLNLSNLTGWWRADDVVLNGSTVSQMNDKTGNGRHMTQGTASKQPLWVGTDSNFNNQSTCSFDGVNDELVGGVAATTLFSVTNWVIGAVYRFSAITGTSPTTTPYANNSLVGLTASGWIGISARNTPVLYGYTFNAGISSYVAAQNTGLANTTTQKAVYAHNSGTLDLYVNNVQGTTVTGVTGVNFSSQNFTFASELGANFGNVQIAEVVTANGNWTANDFIRWNNYCSARYAI